MEDKKSFRERLTDSLIKSMEDNDGAPWEKGWESLMVRPFNPKTKVIYSGGNVLNLILEQLDRGSNDPRWMTLKQANEAGFRIRKGASAATVEYWKDLEKEARKKAEKLAEDGEVVEKDENKGGEKKRFKPFYANLFNGCDIIGLPPFVREMTWQPNDLAEKLIAATGAVIEHTSLSRAGSGIKIEAAYYSHGKDKIILPLRESFKSDGDYYSTVLHELAHWTGHQSRWSDADKGFARCGGYEFGSPDYAREELRAEIASMFLTSMLGVEGEVQNHAKYTSAWLEVLSGDKNEIFYAAKDAERIVNQIFEYAPELRQVVDSYSKEDYQPDKSQAQASNLGSSVRPGLPCFIPDGAQARVRTGRSDPRWAAFESTVRSESTKAGFDEAAVSNALVVIEPKFTELMNNAKDNGYTAEDLNAMLSTSIIDELRVAAEQQQKWDHFYGQVIAVAEKGFTEEQRSKIDDALRELADRYRQLMEKSAQNGWTTEQTEREVHSLIYGEKGRRPITNEYVQSLFADPQQTAEAQIEAKTEADEDDDFVISTLGLSIDDHEDNEPMMTDHQETVETEAKSEAETKAEAGEDDDFVISTLGLSDDDYADADGVISPLGNVEADKQQQTAEGDDDDFIITTLGFSDSDFGMDDESEPDTTNSVVI